MVAHPAVIMQFSQWFRAIRPWGGRVFVLSGVGNPLADAARQAGMTVGILDPSRWPFPGFALRAIASGGQLPATLIEDSEQTKFHDDVRDFVAQELAQDGTVSIKEVWLVAIATKTTAVADLIAASAKPAPDATEQTVIEVKTMQHSELGENQRYVYAVAMVGGHVKSDDEELSKVGLVPNTRLPAMDFMLVTCGPPDFAIHQAYVPASVIDPGATTEAIEQSIRAIEPGWDRDASQARAGPRLDYRSGHGRRTSAEPLEDRIAAVAIRAPRYA